MADPIASLNRLCRTCGYRLESSLDVCPVDGTRLDPEHPAVGKLGPFRLVQRLGIGGMGIVYRATHEKLGRTVAIKMLHRSLVTDSTTIARFFQEARAVNTIRHPNVVDIYDFVTDGSDIYIVMEFLVGVDLHQAIYDAGGHPLPLARAVRIVEQVCGALHAAHSRNLIHRDLKPANIFLTRRNDQDDFVKLLDFGLAKLEKSDGRMTRDGMVLGTPEYMAPEQARGEALDGRADIYALGVVAYEMMTGCQLFPGSGHVDIMVRHVKEAPVPPRRWNPQLPESVEKLLLRCLAKAPNDRPQTTIALARDLATALGQPFDASGTFNTERAAPTSGSSGGGLPAVAGAPAVTDPATADSGLTRRTKLVPKVALAAGALTVLLVAALPARRSGPAPSLVPAAPPAEAPHAPAPPAVLVPVLLQSTPPGANVLDAAGIRLGTTPFSLATEVGISKTITFEKHGYTLVLIDLLAYGSTTKAVVLKPLFAARRKPPHVPASGPAGPSSQPTGGGPPAPKLKVLDSRDKTINPFGK